MTTQTKKYKLYSYKFQVVTDRPIVGYSQPIPFALRLAIKSQLDKMVEDDILETEFSFFSETFNDSKTRRQEYLVFV
jgi:hypothetical protein